MNWVEPTCKQKIKKDGLIVYIINMNRLTITLGIKELCSAKRIEDPHSESFNAKALGKSLPELQISCLK